MSEAETVKKIPALQGEATVLQAAVSERYQILCCLKNTGQRLVYLLADKSSKKFLLKIQALGRPDTLQKEYLCLRELNGRGVPEAVSYMEEDGKEYLIQTYIEGESLQEAVEREGVFTEERSISLLQSLCVILSSLHERKPPVIHRDIKPQNVILTAEGGCALIDFGTARHYRENGIADTIFMGTEATAPPEQFGYAQTDARADIYGAGMLLRYMLTGTLAKPEGHAKTPLERIAERCTAFDPGRRFQSVRGLQRALKLAEHWQKIKTALFGGALLVLALLLAAGLYQEKKSAHFENALLEQAVRQELGIAENQSIPLQRLKEVKQIILCGNQIWTDWNIHEEKYNALKNDSTLWTGEGTVSDLNELSCLPNLEILVLDYQDVSDLSPLTGMKLQYVSLCGNQIRELSAFSNMKTLKALWMEDNPVTDLAPLAGLPELTELEIGGTNVRDAGPLSALPLETLLMRDTLITDYSFLETLPGLRVFTTGKMNKEGLEQVYALYGLEELRLSGSLENLEGFKDFTRLDMLDLSQSELVSLKGVEKLSHLTYLGLGYTSPESLEPLCQSKSLQAVELVGAEIGDYTPLLSCKNLRTVHVGFGQEEKARRQLSGSGLEICAWEE